MTCILYVKDDGIYSDHMYINASRPNRGVSAEYNTKIYLSQDKQFIYALSGVWLYSLDKNREEIEKIIRNYIINMENSYRAAILPIKEGLPSNNGRIANGTMFVLTTTNLLVANIDEEYSINYNLNNDNLPYLGIGSGGPVAEAILRLTGDANLAVKYASETIVSCGLSKTINNGEPDYQSTLMLKPFNKMNIPSLTDA